MERRNSVIWLMVRFDRLNPLDLVRRESLGNRWEAKAGDRARGSTFQKLVRRFERFSCYQIGSRRLSRDELHHFVLTDDLQSHNLYLIA